MTRDTASVTDVEGLVDFLVRPRWTSTVYQSVQQRGGGELALSILNSLFRSWKGVILCLK